MSILKQSLSMRPYASSFDLKRVALVSASCLMLTTPVLAAGDTPSTGDCDTDIATIQQKRMSIIADLNKIAEAGKGKIDPTLSCPKLRNLAAVEVQLKNYMTKNKDWCNVPDALLEQVTEGSTHTGQMAQQACKIANDIRKQQQSGGADQAPTGVRLPAGPL